MTELDYALASYDYPLPPELVAQEPLAERDAVAAPGAGPRLGCARSTATSRELPELLRPGRPARDEPQPRLPRAPARAPRPAAAGRRSCWCGAAEDGALGRDAASRPPAARGMRDGDLLTTSLDRPRSVRGRAGGPPAPRTCCARVRLARRRDQRRRGARAPRPPAAAALHPPRGPAAATASATRPSTRASPAASPRPRRACTSRRRCSRGSTRAASSARSSCCTSAPARSARSRWRTSAHHRVEPERYVDSGAARRGAWRARAADRRRVVAVGTTVTRALETAVGRRRRGCARARRDRPRDRARLPLPRRGRAGHQLPPARLVAAAAGVRLRGARAAARGVSGGGRAALPLLLLRRRHADPLKPPSAEARRSER